jgi:hypothetical protein
VPKVAKLIKIFVRFKILIINDLWFRIEGDKLLRVNRQKSIAEHRMLVFVIRKLKIYLTFFSMPKNQQKPGPALEFPTAGLPALQRPNPDQTN